MHQPTKACESFSNITMFGVIEKVPKSSPHWFNFFETDQLECVLQVKERSPTNIVAMLILCRWTLISAKQVDPRPKNELIYL